uniref:50S ribosomal protein L24, chloroplastic n=2 Tax=Entomoneis paludosa TaxID=265537 RepID=A0A7S2YQP6_9STRA|mmetsp:Transcript_5796/g.12218  ORF Transcript_5796/g.12218 Transcript_5796/m.12218 type:complete len:210 (+) Transcript_5796:109-738(+)
MSARARLMKIATKQLKTNYQKPNKTQLQAAQQKRWNIVRGDKVQVIGGHRAKGEQGVVKEVNRKTYQVKVTGVNMRTIKQKGNPERGIQARKIQTEGYLHYSQVALLDPLQNIPTRIHYETLEDGTKVRVSKKSGAIIPKPEILKHRARPIRFTVTESCTSEDDAWEETYSIPEHILEELEEQKRRWAKLNGEVDEDEDDEEEEPEPQK